LKGGRVLRLAEWGAGAPTGPRLVHDAVVLRPPLFEDCGAWIALRLASRAHLAPWEPAWPTDELSEKSFRLRLRFNWRTLRRGTALPLLVFRTQDGALVGGASLSNIRHGASRSATIGYWIGESHLRKGYGRSAVAAVVAHAFGPMALNRIEAACLPENAASRTLLHRCGFKEEGLARSFLRINGAWRDHVIYAATAADFTDRPSG
jgi:ribosomal-protein-alanine N-acetyltransferase